MTDSLVSNMSSMTIAPAALSQEVSFVSVGGGRKIVIEDFCRVAVECLPVVLDAATLDRVGEDAKKCAQSSADSEVVHSSRVADAGPPAAETLCRAAIFAKVVSTTLARSGVRTEVLELLVALLNKRVVPVFTSADTAGQELVEVISGTGGSCYCPQGQLPTTQAFTNSGLSGVTLSKHERTSIAYGQFFATGMAALFVSGVFNAVAVSDVAAALTCEAAGTTLEAFDAVHFDICRQHRGQMASASNLRQMLEGSKRCVSSAKSLSFLSMLHSPQIHGPAIDTILYCKKYTSNLHISSVQEFILNIFTGQLNWSSRAVRAVPCSVPWRA